MQHEEHELDHSRGVPSRAAISGHPVHPMLIPFPIAFLVGALPADLACWGNGDTFWARAALWLTGAGLATGVLAAVFGLIDFLTIDRVRRHTAGWIHFLGNATVLVLAAVSLWIRWGAANEAVLPWGLALSGANTALLVMTGWYGGEFSYRH